MLLGKLAKPAVKIYQNGAFDNISVNAEYIVVSAQKYVIGQDRVTFEIRFGNIVTEKEHDKEVERFDNLLRDTLTMTTEELSAWGTDDSVLLDLIANKIGNNLLEKVFKNFNYTY